MSFSLKFCAQPLFFSPCASPSPQPFIRSLNDSTRQCAASFTEHLTFALVGQPSSDGPDGLLPKLQALKEQVTTIFACAPDARKRRAGRLARSALNMPNRASHAHTKSVYLLDTHTKTNPQCKHLGWAHTRVVESTRCKNLSDAAVCADSFALFICKEWGGSAC